MNSILVGLLVVGGLGMFRGLRREQERRQLWVVVAVIISGVSLLVWTSTSAGRTSPEVTPVQAHSRAVTSENPAPEFTGITGWINSGPLSLAELRGKVVLVDFWTYSCINCVRTQPYLNAWYERYRDAGFEIVGVHAPEFAFEKVPENVERAVVEAGIRYPVALDNDFATWRAYSNQYWPTKYLIDGDGNIVFSHPGEGAHEELEQRIRDMLNARGPVTSASPVGQATPGQSPEVHLGAEGALGYKGQPDLDPQLSDYSPAGELASSQWHLEGQWQIDGESVTALDDGSTLRIRFDGKELYLVATGVTGGDIRVRVNGGTAAPGKDVHDGVAAVLDSGLYQLVALPEFTTGTLVELEFSEGVAAHAITFGG